MLINDEQPWFKIIHFTNHQLELAIADAFKESDAFQKNYKIAIWTWQYFKNKGKAKSMLIAITRQLNVF